MTKGFTNKIFFLNQNLELGSIKKLFLINLLDVLLRLEDRTSTRPAG
jgi:hypothetical protein